MKFSMIKYKHYPDPSVPGYSSVWSSTMFDENWKYVNHAPTDEMNEYISSLKESSSSKVPKTNKL